MPSASPSPAKRPSLSAADRTSSTHSLSSSSKQSSAHKVHRPHVVSRHSRNPSHGKNLSKLNRVQSAANVTTVAAETPTTKNHQRQRSGATDVSQQSPKSPGLSSTKRNSSHVQLPKNTSLGNLRKNHSATLLTGNRTGNGGAHVAFKKPGLPPTPKPRNEDKKTGFFELADDDSSGGEGGGEWEDSATQSPEFTRNNSKTSTPARGATPNADRVAARQTHPPDESGLRDESTSSPPSPVLTRDNVNRSAPDLRNGYSEPTTEAQEPPQLLQHHASRPSRAPPAMSTISAHAGPNLVRSESSRSFTHIEHAEADSMNNTPDIRLANGGSSSGDRAVSHFLNSASTPSSFKTPPRIEDPDDEDSIAFMENYKPLPSESPEKERVVNKPFFNNTVSSRTQQRLDLERNEALRTPAGPTTPISSLGFGGPSSLSLHSRSGSRGRNQFIPYAMGARAQKLTYESGEKQLNVVRRFRNPMVESLVRMKERGALPARTGESTPTGGKDKLRPQSRRGPSITSSSTTLVAPNGAPKSSLAISRSLEDRQSNLQAGRRGGGASDSGKPAGKVSFVRQGSHDDIGVTPMSGSYDGPEGSEEGISAEEALLRRIWESRDVYDSGEIDTGRR